MSEILENKRLSGFPFEVLPKSYRFYQQALTEVVSGHERSGPSVEFGISIFTSNLSEPDPYQALPMKDIFSKYVSLPDLGHLEALRSLIHSLDVLSIPWCLNPRSPAETYPNAYCFDAPDQNQLLEEVIDLKRQALIQTLLVGPFIDSSLLKPHQQDIDLAFFLSDFGVLLDFDPNKMVVMPAAPDFEFFTQTERTHSQKNDHLMIYYKSDRIPEQASAVKNDVYSLLAPTNLNLTLLNYSHYSPWLFQHALQQVDGVIFIGGWETQSIGMAECWAMDKPTWVYDAYGKEPQNPQWLNRAAPYLLPDCGYFWETIPDLAERIRDFYSEKTVYRPNQWVSHYLSPTVTGLTLLKAMSATRFQN